jgi:hypothetical protein
MSHSGGGGTAAHFHCTDVVGEAARAAVPRYDAQSPSHSDAAGAGAGIRRNRVAAMLGIVAVVAEMAWIILAIDSRLSPFVVLAVAVAIAVAVLLVNQFTRLSSTA